MALPRSVVNSQPARSTVITNVSEDSGGVLAVNNHPQLSRSADCDDAAEAPQSLLGAGSSWSAVAASSPIASVNRLSALDNMNDESDAGEFVPYRSRRKMKRLRQQSTPAQQQQRHTADNHQSDAAGRRLVPSRRAMMGKAQATAVTSGSAGGSGLAAASK